MTSGTFSERQNQLKPIETVYNGYRFRSRLEARWAVFFDALNIPYQYEPEGFDLGDELYYLPDFWLPKQRYWIEIKGKKPSNNELKKIALLADGTGENVYILYGQIGWKEVDINGFTFFEHTRNAIGVIGNINTAKRDLFLVNHIEMAIEMWTESKCQWSGELPASISSIQDIKQFYRLQNKIYHQSYGKNHPSVTCIHLPIVKGCNWAKRNDLFILTDEMNWLVDTDTLVGYRAARQARFEHGETPEV